MIASVYFSSLLPQFKRNESKLRATVGVVEHGRSMPDERGKIGIKDGADLR
jgi:hypothetical protein